jgi:chromosome segregation protein
VLYSRAVRLKELSLQGYKSFATRHRFVFPTGITAIVGPNGSGKSNIADGMRWVLGEQRSTQLRARKADELIFHGTERRARSGLAEVTLTLDNSDRWLDIDFPEVAVTRRAHRDGSIEYLLNGARVRLRDVLDLLGSQLGQSNYTVIGQGLVDSALSLRPDERRALIDEAAGVLPLQRHRDRALRQLQETRDNLTRVLDIAAELGPRLKRMERLADRAAQHRKVAGELEDLLKVWYGYQWHRATEQLARARVGEDEALTVAEAARASASALEIELRSAEADAEAADEALLGWRAERDRLQLAAADARQALALAKARVESLRAREQELAQELLATDGSTAQLDARSQEEAAQLAELAANESDERSRLATAEAALVAAEAAQAERGKAVEDTRAQLFALASQVATLRQRGESLAVQSAARQTEHAGAQSELSRLAAGAETGSAALRVAESHLAVAAESFASTVAESVVAEAELAALGDRLRAARERHTDARLATEALRARASTLEALVGELDQVSPVLPQLSEAGVAVHGTVAALLEVTAGWEAAVAAALGQQVHGLVLQDAESVAQALAAVGADFSGQVTLVPQSDPALANRRRGGAEATLAEEVASAPEAPGLIETLLGGTAFVADLAAARAVLARPDAPSRAATRDGLLVLQGGLVVCGTPVKELLALHSERRGLPEAIAVAAGTEAACLSEADQLAERRRSLESKLGDLAERRARAEAERAAAAEAQAQAQAETARVERERAWFAATVKRLEAEIAQLAAEHERLSGELVAAEPQEATLRATLSTLQDELTTTDLTELRAAVAVAATAVARSTERVAARQAALDGVARERAAEEGRHSDLERRAAETRAGLASALADTDRLAVDVDRHAAAIAALAEQIEPAEAAMRQTRGTLRQDTGRLDESRHRLSALEQRLGEARLAVTRAEDRLDRLYDQLRADGEFLPEVGELPQQLSLDGLSEVPLPPVTELPAEIERRLATLRREIRAIGAIDQEALLTYEETAAYFQTLGSQRQDLEQAEGDLHTALAQLEAEMQTLFDATFAEVAAAFGRYFPQLFGGGEAALVLAEAPAGSPPGIDILARPPGKRSQPLALLSGGERALTAVALVFALLQVSGTPFVLLDEVDAALDEANVDRFCAALRDLAEVTQVVIVTHNRNTIQAAGTVYGISMADDGASQVISLRVDSVA